VQPVLTPDPGVYTKAVLDLINGAQKTLYIQTQYINVSDKPEDADFMALVQAVIDCQRRGLDVRIITSEFETGAKLELLQGAGLDLSGVRIQNNVHNKGIIADSSTVLVSSQNWSSAGVLQNRDAGVLVFDADVAGYFEQVFLHDWTNLAHQSALD
jgi:phosphatidylserine/phosphatidylglycerophosphate/cardiolipin synthase-like enzyme